MTVPSPAGAAEFSLGREPQATVCRSFGARVQQSPDLTILRMSLPLKVPFAAGATTLTVFA